MERVVEAAVLAAVAAVLVALLAANAGSIVEHKPTPIDWRLRYDRNFSTTVVVSLTIRFDARIDSCRVEPLSTSISEVQALGDLLVVKAALDPAQPYTVISLRVCGEMLTAKIFNPYYGRSGVTITVR